MRSTVLNAMVGLSLAVVFACSGCSGGAGGNAPNNAVTAADAGSIQNVTTGALVTLNGNGSTGAQGKLLTYQWSFVAKPAGSTVVLSSDTVVNPTFTPDLPGEYVLGLVVNDGATSSGQATVTITAVNANSAPVANAGPAQNVPVNTTVTLNGSHSSDADNDLLTYEWTLASKPTDSGTVLLSSNTVTPTFTPDKAGNYVFNLTVNDGESDSMAATVTITAAIPNAIPVANAGQLQNVFTGAVVHLDGSLSSDADGDLITYSWAFTSKPVGSGATLSSSTAVNPTFAADVAGAYVLNLVVSDGKATSPSVPVTINASRANAVPMADAGVLQSVTNGTPVTLDGSKSSDADGDLISYRWTMVSKPGGSSAVLSSTVIVNPTFTTDVAGAYVFSLVVTDGKADSAASTVTINSARPNAAPVANAGMTQNIYTGAVVTLDGSWSSDADGDVLTYRWGFTSKPAGSGAVLSAATTAMPTFIADVAGAYVCNLAVNDGKVSSAVATVTINATVANAAPVASAGIAQSVVTGAIVTLDGGGSSDADGDLLTYSWAFTSKPAGSSAMLSGASVVKPIFTPDVAGAYVLNLVVNDGKMSSAAATVTVTAASTARYAVNPSVFNNNGVVVDKVFYQLTSPFASLDIQTDATSVTVDVFNNLYATFPGFTTIGVYVNGGYHQTIIPGAPGATRHAITLPTGTKSVSFVNGFQSTDFGTTVLGTFVTRVSSESPLTQLQISPVSRVLAYGDSISVGASAADPTRYGWVMQLRQAAYPNSVALEGRAYRSLREDAGTAERLHAFVTTVSRYAPDIIWLCIGTNDYGTGQWNAASFGTAYASLLDAIHAALPNVKVYCQTPLVRSSEAVNSWGNTLDEYRAEITQAVSARTAYCTLIDGKAILTIADLADGLHPSTAGHTKYADYVKRILHL